MNMSVFSLVKLMSLLSLLLCSGLFSGLLQAGPEHFSYKAVADRLDGEVWQDIKDEVREEALDSGGRWRAAKAVLQGYLLKHHKFDYESEGDAVAFVEQLIVEFENDRAWCGHRVKAQSTDREYKYVFDRFLALLGRMTNRYFFTVYSKLYDSVVMSDECHWRCRHFAELLRIPTESTYLNSYYWLTGLVGLFFIVVGCGLLK